MNRIRINLSKISILMLLFSSGCYNEIDLEKYKNEEILSTLVVNSIISPDSPIKVVVTHPYFFSDSHPNPIYQEDLSLRLYRNGEYLETIECDKQTHSYNSTYNCTEGDRIDIATVYNGTEVSASDTIPHMVRIEEFKPSIMGKSPGHVFEYLVEYAITFTDPKGEENYYFLNFGTDKYRNQIIDGCHINFTPVDDGYENEFVFQILARQISGSIPGWRPYSVNGLPFSDTGIDGKKYTIHVLQQVWANGNTSILSKAKTNVKLYSISKSYYKYLISLLSNDPEDDSLHGSILGIGIAEPDKIFSNVKGGAGIVGSYVVDEKVSILK